MEKLTLIEQQHLLKNWNNLSEDSKKILAKQIEAIDIAVFHQQKKAIQNPPQSHSTPLSSFHDYQEAGNPLLKAEGQALIAEGKVGCLIVAGGQGTRLKIDGPKGIFPISLIQRKSLFQLFAEKTLAASKQGGTALPLAIMTSPLNHQETLHFFDRHHYFGLSADQLSFFSQGMLPFLDDRGSLFLEEIDRIAFGPDGNGMSLVHFYKSGIWEKWHNQEVQWVNYILIDNPLADPFDAELVGFHADQNLEISIKCIPRLNTQEKVGIIVKKEGKTEVIEYTEVPPHEREARLPNGQLKHPCANISLFCFSMDFIKKYVDTGKTLPLHVNWKPAKCLNTSGEKSLPTFQNAWKFETFIFDLLPETSRVKGLLYRREDCFAPLKNDKGEASPETVRAALLAQDRKILEKITGLPAPREAFELSQDFHYPTEALLNKWDKRCLNRVGYIEP
ncbi:UTP--glucose-1-phosphate uridylyltransferase [Parachlamydia sp. AcF125]|uniref:UTP--glucose-1-phosphate uridylyltransferase n=1 Tax=Parachlamydia sp. AcF125 TaxID=2795736 RepID=UPI001BD888F7|nr:UTP--glucose-1-phosphate uridylyltransferase [Parachlamydia sp. AcF125]MBS4167614.1 putative uridylyltransferase [Parachlamydia sp. AcF125]